MEKFNKILKNILIFLVVFLLINYIFQSCQDKPDPLSQSGSTIALTTEQEYSRRQTVNVELMNNSKEDVTIKNECPAEPLNVYRYENDEWTQKEVSPELDCENAEDIVVKPGEKTQISYSNWNHALFSEMGRYKIEFVTTISEEEKTFASNEFTIVEENIFWKMAIGLFYRPIYNGLIFLTAVLPGHNLGLAIILLTLLIRTILLLPSHRAMRSQKKMQEIQPRLEKIKEKYKGDQQRIATETMAIWKEAKVNPFGSCLPLLMQFPFLIALFYAIQNGLNPDNSYLLYTSYDAFSLADINVHFLGLNLTKANLYVLPLIIGGLQFLQMKLSFLRREKKGESKPKNEMAMANTMMTYIMPVMIAVFTASLPAGVGIYWGTSTLYGIFQQIVINKEKTPASKDEPTVRVITKN